ncbi:snoRNA-binding rRNA-processing protein utp10 [Coemansia sp. BCRC 34962]|nr:snoRNA-binding rRNA-processing protein utp10 [Coemansia sp. BCRC 34962]
MASSLASQLYKMRTLDRAIGNERTHNVKASFLFDGRQAADLDTQTIFDIGRDGLYELRQINQRFDVYAETLFSESIKDMDRVLQTKEENAKLDGSIRSFLFQLAPHFLTKPAGKTIEWLVRRFRIHEFNARDVLAAIMPYHETKAFLTMLTIITFETADMDLFGFLVAQRKSRRLLDRQTLMAQCLRDRSLMAFVCQSVFRACRQDLDYPGLHSFYAMVMSQYIGQLSTIDNSAIQFIVPFVLDGLNLSSKDAQAAAYMVLGSLATRVTLTEDALDKVLCAIAKRPADVRTMAMCLVQVLQTQANAFNSRLPARFLGILAGHAKLPQILCQLTESYNVEMFMRPLLSSLAHYAFTIAELSQFLAALVAVLPVSYAPALCERIIAECIAHGLKNGSPAEIVDIVQLRYGQQLEDAIGAAASGSEMGGDREAVHKLLYELKARGSGNKSGVVLIKETATTLYLSINHADAGIRLVAAKALRAIVTGERTDVELAREEASGLIVDRLAQDDSEKVLEVVLSLPLATLVDAQDLIPALVSIIEDERVPIAKLCSKVLRNLLAIDAEDSQMYGQVVSALFPYLLRSTDTEAVTKAVYKYLPGSAFGKHQGGWLACLASAELDSGLAISKFNKSATRALATELAAKWDVLSDAQAGVWVAQLRSANRMARTTAVVVGAQAAKLLAKANDVSRCAAAASLVVRSALDLLLEQNSSDAASGDVLTDGLTSSQGEAETKATCDTLSATLSVLSSVIKLQPNQWFTAESATVDSAEWQYRDLLRSTFVAIVSRAGKLSNSDGVLIGRVLGLGMGDEWAQFLASTWTAETSSALVKSRSLVSFQALLSHKTGGSSTEKIDYQTVLPCVIVALGDEDARVRGAAVACVKTLHSLYPSTATEKKQSSSRKSVAADEQTIYGYDVFYGATSDKLQYLPTATVAKFVAMLGSRVDSMVGDAWAVRNELGMILNHGVCSGSGKEDAQLKLNSQGRSSVTAFFLSHAVAADAAATWFQTRLLQALELVTSPAHVLAQLYPLIGSHYDRLKRTVGIPQEGGSEDMLVRALFRACFCEANAQRLGEMGCWPAFLGFVDGLDSAPASGEWTAKDRAAAYVQQVALERLMADGLVAAMGEAAVTEVTVCLFRVAVRGTVYLAPAEVRQVALRDVYTRVGLDAVAAADELSEMASKLTLDDSDAARAGKRARAQAPSAASAVLPELGTLLEYMQCSPTLVHNPTLVPALFSLLSAFVSDVEASTEYAKQLVLGMLTRICDEANLAGVAIAESFMRVDAIVQVIRTSARPQTHNQTLLLLAAVAAMHPQVVLHHVMAIFTFMGANVLRQDDEYSFHVIQQTLERVIPPVVRDGGAENAGPVLRVFVDALSHIPRHRRMALFSTLVRTMGVDAYAPAVVSLLLEKNVRRVLGRAAEDVGKERDDIVSFALSLTHELPPAQQIGSAEAVVRDLLLLPSGEGAEDVAAGQELFIDVAHMGSRQLRAYRLVALDFAHQLLTGRQFRAQFDRVRATPEINARLSSATSSLLQVITRLNSVAAERAAEKQALQLAYSVLDDVNALMERRTFVATVVSLLEQSDLKIRRKVMALANAKLTEFNVRLVQSDSPDIDEMLGMLEPIATIAEQGPMSVGAEEAACRQAALLCVATAAKKFAVLRPALFTGVVRAVSAAESLGSSSPGVTSAALVALAVLCNELGSRLIPSLPQYLPQVLKHLHDVVGRYAEASADDLTLMVAALSAMQAIVENMSAFLAPTLAPLFSCLLNPAIRSALEDGDDDVAALREQTAKLTDDVLAAVAKSIPPRLLLPAQFAFYQKEASRQGAAVIVPFVEFVGRTASSLQRNQLLQFYKPLFKFFLAAFDIACNPELPLSDVEVIEQATLDAFMRFVVKLNENLFKPLFLSFLEWATADVAAVADLADEARMQSVAETRLRVFYRALNMLFDKLRSILTPYYAHVLDTTVEVLNRFAVARASIELQEEADRKVIPAPSALWHAVVESIYQSALHDTTDFWKEETFKRVYRPLAHQLPNTKATDKSAEQAHALYMERVSKSLAPAIGQLAAAAGNDALWKMINQEVMLKSRSDVPAVRVASLIVLQALYAKLGEEFLILLPETIPFLAELLEDDNGLVERATQETVKVIESHLGESLQSYLR